jgi:hypothetical protein
MEDIIDGFFRSQAALAAGKKPMIFDWDKAATLIALRKVKVARAGLQEDWDYTGGTIFEDGNPVEERGCIYLASLWAIPELELDGEIVECWRYEDQTPGWDAHTFWPESALKILNTDWRHPLKTEGKKL